MKTTYFIAVLLVASSTPNYVVAEPTTTAAAVAMLYGPAKDLGETLIEIYFDRRARIMQQEAHNEDLRNCDKMYVKFWDRVEAKTMDEETTKRYGEFFEKHCIKLWQDAAK